MNEGQKIVELYNLYLEDKLPQTFLIETNNLESCLEEVKNFLRRITCPNHHNEKDENCSFCNLISRNQYPEMRIINVESQEIPKDEIISLKKWLAGTPVLSGILSYVIVEGEKLNLSSSNSLLKLLEEPSPGIIGFIITSQKEKILPTIRSRCYILSVIYSAPNKINSIMDQILFDHYNFINFDKLLCYEDIFKENYNRIFLIDYYKYVIDKTLSNIKDNNGIQVMKIASKTLNMLESKVGLDMCNDYFTIEMRKLNAEK